MPSLIDILLPEKVRISQVIPHQFQQYVYPFSKPIFKSTSSFTRLEQIITIHGCRILNVVNIVSEETIMRSRRKNDSLTLHIMLQGNITWFAPFKGKVPLRPGEYNLLRMNTGPHDLLLQPGVNEFIQLDIPPSLLQDLLPASPLVQCMLAKNISCQSPVSARPIEQKFHALIHDIRHTHVTDGIQQLRLYAHITELITAAVANLQQSLEMSKADYSGCQMLDVIKEYINRNLHKPLTIPHLAALYFISESKLKQLFRKHEDMPVRKYLQEQRMQKALQLLLNTDQKINIIAAEVGYTNVSSFIREFKKHYACSPNQARIGNNNI
ncbi:MAG TPA: AraC family transcriptional regulator [Chitinophaga sp.]|nr:AraC family transcriptional regulator [Chitinophaga sp.]